MRSCREGLGVAYALVAGALRYPLQLCAGSTRTRGSTRSAVKRPQVAGWWEAAAGPRSKDAGREPRPEGGPLTRVEGGGRGCRGHGGRQKVSGRRAAAPLARKGLIKVQDN